MTMSNTLKTNEDVRQEWGDTWANYFTKLEKERQERRERQSRQSPFGDDRSIQKERWICLESHDKFTQGQVYTAFVTKLMEMNPTGHTHARILGKVVDPDKFETVHTLDFIER